MPRHAPAAPVTDEQLRLAFRQIRQPGWPGTLEAALADHTYRVCLYGIARNLGRVGMDRAPRRQAEPELPLFDPATGDPAP